MLRRRFLFGLLLAPLVLSSSRAALADTAADGTILRNTTNLLVVDADTMKKMLRTVTPDDDKFINRVYYLVNKKKTVPPELVNTTFEWAKRKGRNRFYYFKDALILRAAQQGITIKP